MSFISHVTAGGPGKPYFDFGFMLRLIALQAPAAKKARSRRRPASTIAIPTADLFPAILIAGEPVPVELTQAYADPKAAERAARHWCRAIAWKIGTLVPEPQSCDAERFAMRHRLSIANAFHRRLRRADVIAWILELFAAQPNISHVA
jgi:hypothetical protein